MRPENTNIWRKGLRRPEHGPRVYYSHRQLARYERMATLEALRVWREGNRVNAGAIPHG